MELRAFYNKLLPETGVYCLFNKATKEHLWADGLTAFLELSENTITNGKATMQSYADKLEPADRWAVIAYVRALQRAQTGSVADVPEVNKAELGLK